jgi:hypothetical protein
LLDRGEESVHVHMDDVWDFARGTGLRERSVCSFCGKGSSEGLVFGVASRLAVTEENVHRAPVREAGKREFQRAASGS